MVVLQATDPVFCTSIYGQSAKHKGHKLMGRQLPTSTVTPPTMWSYRVRGFPEGTTAFHGNVLFTNRDGQDSA